MSPSSRWIDSDSIHFGTSDAGLGRGVHPIISVQTRPGGLIATKIAGFAFGYQT